MTPPALNCAGGDLTVAMGQTKKTINESFGVGHDYKRAVQNGRDY